MQTIRPFLSVRAATWVTSLLLSALMSAFVSALSTLSATGLASMTMTVWASAWLTSWMLAFPALTVLAPLVRRLVGSITCSPELETIRRRKP